MIEIKEMEPYALKPGDAVKFKNEVYLVWGPMDKYNTIQIYKLGGRPFEVINVHVDCIDIIKTGE